MKGYRMIKEQELIRKTRSGNRILLCKYLNMLLNDLSDVNHEIEEEKKKLLDKQSKISEYVPSHTYLMGYTCGINTYLSIIQKHNNMPIYEITNMVLKANGELFMFFADNLEDRIEYCKGYAKANEMVNSRLIKCEISQMN